jgi:hypothetical protein
MFGMVSQRAVYKEPVGIVVSIVPGTIRSR